MSDIRPTDWSAEIDALRGVFSHDGEPCSRCGAAKPEDLSEPCPRLLNGHSTVAAAVSAMLRRELSLHDAMQLLELSLTEFRTGAPGGISDLESAIEMLRVQLPGV